VGRVVPHFFQCSETKPQYGSFRVPAREVSGAGSGSDSTVTVSVLVSVRRTVVVTSSVTVSGGDVFVTV
jgi:hypothetical protein